MAQGLGYSGRNKQQVAELIREVGIKAKKVSTRERQDSETESKCGNGETTKTREQEKTDPERLGGRRAGLGEKDRPKMERPSRPGQREARALETGQGMS